MNDWLAIPHLDLYAVVGILTFFGLIEAFHGHYQNSRRRKDDWILEMVGFFIVAITKAAIVVSVAAVASMLIPKWANGLDHWAFGPAFLFYILIDDFLQYSYHRFAHENRFLWKHHISHHAAEEMGILVSYRNSWVYYILMPNIWWIALSTFLGLAPEVVLGVVLKQLVVTSSHSTWTWDSWLYRRKWLHPLAWLLERIFITPAFHHAHHGKSKLDGISDPNGNFGNTFSIWDQLFGTAQFTRKFPRSYGLLTDPKDPWHAQLLYPLARSSKTQSELGRNFKKTKQTQSGPAELTLAAGTYLYCQCGLSTNQPFCNGYHHGTKHKPLLFEISKEKKVRICTCKMTKSPPYCDNSHLAKGNQN